MKTILQSLRIYVVLTLLTGIIYPLALTGIAQVLFPRQANGSRIIQQHKLIGSELIAQKFESARYFWPRPSAADYATVPSGASNKGPTAADLKKVIAERHLTFGAEAPVDLLTASGSGVDPHISPEAALGQIPRIAAARNLAPGNLRALLDHAVEPPQFGFLGEPRVNVLRINLALDAQP